MGNLHLTGLVSFREKGETAGLFPFQGSTQEARMIASLRPGLQSSVTESVVLCLCRHELDSWNPRAFLQDCFRGASGLRRLVPHTVNTGM